MIILKYKKPNNKIERRMAPKFFHKVLSKIKSKNLLRAMQATLIAMIISFTSKIMNVRNIKNHLMNIF
jgi:hypothetical protein